MLRSAAICNVPGSKFSTFLALPAFWENGRWITGTEETLRAVERSGACRRTLVAGQRLWLGSALLTVLNPD
ncbi:MAG TPA: hypothetical protein VEV39_05645, partial [Gemmatimonadales bacterium]|nr:hypothetical protein [Gemmatimonadales bacterium]